MDYSYFHLLCDVSPTSTVFGISCNRQMASDEVQNKGKDVTRSTVQKAIVVLASKVARIHSRCSIEANLPSRYLALCATSSGSSRVPSLRRRTSRTRASSSTSTRVCEFRVLSIRSPSARVYEERQVRWTPSTTTAGCTWVRARASGLADPRRDVTSRARLQIPLQDPDAPQAAPAAAQGTHATASDGADLNRSCSSRQARRSNLSAPFSILLSH